MLCRGLNAVVCFVCDVLCDVAGVVAVCFVCALLCGVVWRFGGVFVCLSVRVCVFWLYCVCGCFL